MNRTLPANRCFGTIFNNDLNNITYSLDGANVVPGDYTRAVHAILDSRPGVFA
jgi:hypothetical protein